MKPSELVQVADQIPVHFDRLFSDELTNDRLLGMALAQRNGQDVIEIVGRLSLLEKRNIPPELPFQFDGEARQLKVQFRPDPRSFSFRLAILIVKRLLVRTGRFLNLLDKCRDPYCSAQTPYLGGCCIQSQSGESGTLGGRVDSPGGDAFFVTCAHVAVGVSTVAGGITDGSIYTSLSIQNGAPSGPTIGNVNLVSQRRPGTVHMRSDAALVSLKPGTRLDWEIRCLGRISGLATAFLGNTVSASGAGGGLTRGKVLSVGGAWIFPYDSNRYIHVVETSGSLGGPGDSGALLISPHLPGLGPASGNRLLGVLFRKEGSSSFASDIRYVLADLGMNRTWRWS